MMFATMPQIHASFNGEQNAIAMSMPLMPPLFY